MIFLFIFLAIIPLYGQISENELLGKINPITHQDFIKIKSNGKFFYLRTEVAVKYEEMAEKAKKEGINLFIVSAFRSFEDQKNIWEYKNKKYSYLSKQERVKKILEYSSMPGTSRHHWGTDIDLVSVNPSFFDSLEGKKIFNWLTNNASNYGFFMPYSSGRKNGFREEKWHWSYKPLAQKFILEYTNKIKYEDLSGFFGSELAKELKIFENYVLNISID